MRACGCMCVYTCAQTLVTSPIVYVFTDTMAAQEGRAASGGLPWGKVSSKWKQLCTPYNKQEMCEH